MQLYCPNFPLVVTHALITQLGETCSLEHYLTFRYQEHWRVYAFREPGWVYWRVDVVTKDDWLLQFDVPTDPADISFNLCMFRGWLPFARHRPSEGRHSGHSYEGYRPNPVFDKYFNSKRPRWDMGVEPLPWQTPEEVNSDAMLRAFQSRR